MSEVSFQRIGDQPLLVPRPGIDWEAGGVFAPAVIQDGATYRMIYRAFGADKVSRLGYATSTNGVEWERQSEPLIVPDPNDIQESQGLEDPRIAKIGSDFYITYTAATGHAEADGWHWKTRIRFLKTSDFISFERVIPELREVDDKDGVLFPAKVDGSYWLLHRYPPDIWISRSPDLLKWQKATRLVRISARPWESLRIGAGTTPIETELGWLLFYHGVSQDLHYSMSALVLDRDDPAIVRYQLPIPLLEPERDYEVKGVVSNVVFGTSVVEVDGDYRLYYGAADYCIAAARIDKEALLAELRRYAVG